MPLVESTFQNRDRSAFDFDTNEGFVVWDRNQKLVAWSKRCPDFWYQPEGLLRRGMPMLELLLHIAKKGGLGQGNPEVLAERELKRVRESGPDSIDEFGMLDGRIIQVQRNATPDGGHASTYTDVTARRAAENALRRSEVKFRGLVDRSPDLISAKNLEGEYTLANSSFQTVLATDAAALMGRGAFDLFPGEIAEVLTRNDLAARDGLISGEETLPHPDGTVHTYQSKTFPLKDEARRLIGTATIACDISSRKAAEVELIDARNLAEDKNRAKSEYLANMSHELRTPLNAILGFAQLMKLDRKEPLTEAQTVRMDNLLSAGNHLLELINDVLDLAKIEAEKIPILLEDVGVSGVVDECIAMTSPLVDARGLTILNQLAPGDQARVRADRLMFRQALLNFLSNAVKYNTEKGTIRVKGSVSSPGHYRVSVEDTGIGIAAESGSRIFEMFDRGGDHAKLAAEGAGIGLAVTKMLVVQMNGHVGFESTRGAGSVFWIELPYVS